MEKKLSQRLVSIMLGICMVFMCLPQRTLPRINAAATNYGIKINSINVTSDNASDILGDGHFRYDASENKLYMKGYNDFSFMNKSGDVTSWGVSNEGAYGLTMVAEEDCVIVGYILCRVNTTITGSGKIQVKSPTSTYDQKYIKGCIEVMDNLTTLLIKDADIDVNFDIFGTSTTALNVINSNVNVGRSVYDFNGGITLDNCYIKSPEKSYVNGSKIVKGDYNAPIKIVPGTDPDPYFPPVSAGIKIGATEVNSDNADDVLGDGVFSFDADTKTLNINGEYDGTILNISCDGLIINTVSDSTVEGIDLRTETIITGDGKLTVSQKIDCKGSLKLTIKNAYITATSINGLYTNDKYSLEIENSTVSSIIWGFKEGITLKGCQVVDPVNASIINGDIRNEYGNLPNVYICDPDKYWYFTYDNTKVTSDNFEEVFGDAAEFDEDTRTMTITEDLEKGLVNSGCDGLTVNLVDDVYLHSFHVRKDTTFTGKGNVKNSIEAYDGATVTIDNADIEILGSLIGKSNGEKLDIICSDVWVSLYINGFTGGITLEDTEFLPNNSAQKLSESEVNTADVTFRAKGDPLGIFVGDTEVDTKNASDVLRNGKVVYSPISNCLYLYGDIDLSGCKSPTIRNESCEGLTITTDDSKTSKTSFSIKGGLEIMAETFIDPGYRHMDYTITPVNGNAITVSNGALLTINARSLNAGGAIAGSGTGEQLKIRYCDLDCVGDGESSAINGFNNGIILENCKITEPVGADVNGSAVLTADGEPVEKLHIDRQIRYGVMVNLVQLTEDNLDSIGELFSKSDDAMEKYLNGEEFVSFDPETNTLTLKDVDLSGDVLIFTDVDLNIEGDVKFGKIMSFMGENEFRITGPGTLTSTSSSAYLYSCFNASLSISETTINSDIKAITDGSLTIFSSNINAPNGISEFKGGIALKECSVESPKKAIIGTSIYESDGSTIASNVVIGGSHIHTEKMTLVEAVEPTCVTAGNIAYYKCTCGRYFTDENAENEIALSETVIPATGHSLALVEGVEATCEENGCLQHYSCENCGVFFYDENGESPVIFPTDLIIYAKGHDYGSPVYRWNSDLSQATAYCVCSNDSEHIISETVDTTYTDNNGERTYLADFEYYRFSDQSIKVEIPEIPETVLVGDANSDGNVDVLDAILIAHYANGWPDTELDTDAADIDRDGEINVLDAMLITRYVNGWDGYNKYIIQVLR
ncbi:dockerin type I repeat-containing protein [Ruminococcus flavefaciens]|uniref:dockerin type I repeat-containing protein n=1 Tax=Ruminococcus flavefaciens TaxID=1265 RepID=UPI0015655674|nr:dockerin type I repeat-containing protein [Ruminococcus flavefaciens]